MSIGETGSNKSADAGGAGAGLTTLGAWLLALIWVAPLLCAIWTAFHPAAYAVRFDLTAPLTIENFAEAWAAARFARYLVNSFILVTMILAGQLSPAPLPPMPSPASPLSAATCCSSWFCCS